MASYFNLTLDTLAPQGVSFLINGGAVKTGSTAVTLTITCTDSDKTGYSMKIWGDCTAASTEQQATWETFNTSKSITLTSGDALKTLHLKVRDDVYNEAAAVTQTITLDSSAPVVTITGPDVAKISKQSGKDTCIFNFTTDEDFVEYKVKVVPSTSSVHTAGTQIGTTGGSEHMSGTGSFPAATAIQCTIKGSDYETAVGGADGAYIVKVFAKDDNDNWSA